MCGTPIIVNVTGGLQDQCGFKMNGEYLTYKDYKDIETLHDWRKWEHNKDLTYGEWKNQYGQEVVHYKVHHQQFYIFDDRTDWYEVADKINEWYEMPKETRDECGFKGHEWVCSDDAMMSTRHMCQNFIDHMETHLKNGHQEKDMRYLKYEETINSCYPPVQTRSGYGNHSRDICSFN